LSQAWELDSIDKQGTLGLSLIDLLILRWSSKKNEAPLMKVANLTRKTKNIFNSIESKFQISFKTKVMQGVFYGIGDLWVGILKSALADLQ
jgi:phospholipase A1